MLLSTWGYIFLTHRITAFIYQPVTSKPYKKPHLYSAFTLFQISVFFSLFRSFQGQFQ